MHIQDYVNLQKEMLDMFLMEAIECNNQDGSNYPLYGDENYWKEQLQIFNEEQ